MTEITDNLIDKMTRFVQKLPIGREEIPDPEVFRDFLLNYYDDEYEGCDFDDKRPEPGIDNTELSKLLLLARDGMNKWEDEEYPKIKAGDCEFYHLYNRKYVRLALAA